MSVAGGISAGAVYGNKGDDSLFVNAGGLRKPSVYGGGGNDSVHYQRQAVTSLYYEGGLDADSLKVNGCSDQFHGLWRQQLGDSRRC